MNNEPSNSDFPLKQILNNSTPTSIISLLDDAIQQLPTSPDINDISSIQLTLALHAFQKILSIPKHSLAYNIIHCFKQFFPNGTPTPTTVSKQTKEDLISMQSQIATYLSSYPLPTLQTLQFLSTETDIKLLADHLSSIPHPTPDHSIEPTKENTYFLLKMEHSLNPHHKNQFSPLATMMLILESNTLTPTTESS